MSSAVSSARETCWLLCSQEPQQQSSWQEGFGLQDFEDFATVRRGQGIEECLGGCSTTPRLPTLFSFQANQEAENGVVQTVQARENAPCSSMLIHAHPCSMLVHI